VSTAAQARPAAAGNGLLLPHHRDDLHRSGLSDRTIAENKLRSVVNRSEIVEILGWDPGDIGPALAFKFRHPDSSFNGFQRIKPDRPRPAGGKYEQPLHAGSRAYFTLRACEAIHTPGAMLVVTEGEKKSLAIAQCGYAAIGLTGVWNWQQKRQKEDGPDGRTTGPRVLIPDLAAIDWGGRRVLIVFDTDEIRKPDVNYAAAELARVLREHGADV
jgi:hypothetical protein